MYSWLSVSLMSRDMMEEPLPRQDSSAIGLSDDFLKGNAHWLHSAPVQNRCSAKMQAFLPSFLELASCKLLRLNTFCTAEWFPPSPIDAFMLPTEWTHHYTKCTFFFGLEKHVQTGTGFKTNCFPVKGETLSFPMCWIEHFFATLDIDFQWMITEHKACYFPDPPYLFPA